ncbi:hypothetical protein AOLI_G00138750 [Acnodon oligacanthus]
MLLPAQYDLVNITVKVTLTTPVHLPEVRSYDGMDWSAYLQHFEMLVALEGPVLQAPSHCERHTYQLGSDNRLAEVSNQVDMRGRRHLPVMVGGLNLVHKILRLLLVVAGAMHDLRRDTLEMGQVELFAVVSGLSDAESQGFLAI